MPQRAWTEIDTSLSLIDRVLNVKHWVVQKCFTLAPVWTVENLGAALAEALADFPFTPRTQKFLNILEERATLHRPTIMGIAVHLLPIAMTAEAQRGNFSGDVAKYSLLARQADAEKRPEEYRSAICRLSKIAEKTQAMPFDAACIYTEVPERLNTPKGKNIKRDMHWFVALKTLQAFKIARELIAKGKASGLLPANAALNNKNLKAERKAFVKLVKCADNAQEAFEVLQRYEYLTTDQSKHICLAAARQMSKSALSSRLHRAYELAHAVYEYSNNDLDLHIKANAVLETLEKKGINPDQTVQTKTAARAGKVRKAAAAPPSLAAFARAWLQRGGDPRSN